MSKVAITGNASGTGTFTLAAPNSNSDRTLTLPDNTGTILTNATAGTVLQVVQGTYATATDITSTSYADSGLSASITPSSASSKILIIASMAADFIRFSNGVTGTYHNLVRNSTQIIEKIAFTGAGTSSSGFVYFPSFVVVSYLDSPNTTSSVTYKVQGKLSDNGNSATLRYQVMSGTSVINLMEIAA
jgi:hypothetical protein